MSREVRVFDERYNKHVVIALNEAQIIQAQRDASFLEAIVNQHYEDLARAIQERETQSQDQAQAIPEKDNQSEDQALAIQETEAQSSQNIIELDFVHGNSIEENAAKSQLFIWSDACIYLLLTIYEENKENFLVQRHKKVFDAIARKMRDVNPEYIMTGSQCQSKINSLKKTYKKIKDHNSKSGNDHATWPFFNRMDELFGSTGWANPVAVASEAGPSSPGPSTSETQETVQPKKRRLESLLENLLEEKKKSRMERVQERTQNFQKLLEQKDKQHKEKMELLKSLLNRDRTQ